MRLYPNDSCGWGAGRKRLAARVTSVNPLAPRSGGLDISPYAVVSIYVDRFLYRKRIVRRRVVVVRQ